MERVADLMSSADQIYLNATERGQHIGVNDIQRLLALRTVLDNVLRVEQLHLRRKRLGNAKNILENKCFALLSTNLIFIFVYCCRILRLDLMFGRNLFHLFRKFLDKISYRSLLRYNFYSNISFLKSMI